MEQSSFASAIFTALPYFLQLESTLLRETDKKRFKAENFEEDQSYDFIVVGGGTAGCIVASRLSEKFSVLLLEHGGDPPSLISVPNFHNYYEVAPNINDFYISTPQRHANNRRIAKTMGKMLGGTGSHNTLIYNRGHPNDYDNWANLVNDTSWKYKNLLKFFKKIETYKGIWPIKRQHGKRGPVRIETSRPAFLSVWKAAAAELGFPYADPNGPQQEGFNAMEYTREDGRRVSTYTAYILPFLNRKTLTVLRYAEVQKILVSNERATGVQYLRHGRQLKAYAQKEVILCAGVFASPLILMRSGIGPAKMLRRAGIKPILNLPAVGKYLQDHVGVAAPPITVDPSSVATPENNLTVQEFEKFWSKDPTESLLAETGLTPQLLLTSNVAKSKGQRSWPDTQIRRTNCPKTGIFQRPNQLCFDVIADRPEFSRSVLGTVKLNTSAYLDGETDNVKLAIIDIKILKSEMDTEVLREGLKFVSRIAKTEAFKSIGAVETVDSECGAKFDPASEPYWKCYSARIAYTHFHTAGTCRMGIVGDRKNSVVDSTPRVHGIQNLRVVDASIMPQVTNANTNAAVMVIAEKASEVIAGQH